MCVLALATQKGGSAKSTLAVGLAVAATESRAHRIPRGGSTRHDIEVEGEIPMHASLWSPLSSTVDQPRDALLFSEGDVARTRCDVPMSRKAELGRP
jgi:Mrp family chromosome partitioning ATPase